MGMPHFHGEKSCKFCIWCTMAHRKGFASVYAACINMLVLRRAGDLQSIKYIDACHIHGKPTSLGDMDQNNHIAIIVHTV